MSAGWRHRWLLTWRPLRRTADNSSWTGRHWENPRTPAWGWSSPLHHRDQDRLQSKVREVTAGWPRCPSRRPAPYRAESFPLSLRGLQGDSQPPSTVDRFVGAPTLVSPHGDYRGICDGDLWEGVDPGWWGLKIIPFYILQNRKTKLQIQNQVWKRLFV